MTDQLCLRVGRHRWYQSITRVIHHIQSYFRKPTVRICLDAHIRTTVVLTGGKLTEIYFLHLLYSIYYSVMMHLQQGKEVSILPPGDVNPGSVSSRWVLLGDSPYRAVRTVSVVRLVTTTHLGRGDLGVSCGHLCKIWIHSCNICSVVHETLNTWAPLGG
jgi:hypothetical protein